ncbi:MAG: hypothetical protein ACSHXL_05935, partial [Bacteroidota bacterium]
MKKIYKFLGLVCLLAVPFTGKSQVFQSTDFNSGVPAGWTTASFATNTSANACGSQAMRANLYSFNPTGNITTVASSATGGQIDISFDYKIVNWNTNTATTGNWGTLTLEHTINGGTTWSTDTVINQSNHVPANTCATVTTFTSGVEVPNGSTVSYRFSGAWSNGDYDLYIDNVNIIEAVTCPLPSGLILNSSDLVSATFSWTPGSTETQWATEYGPVGFTPGTGTSALTSNNTLETISSLTPNSFYHLYVRAACSPGDTSGFLGPITFNTYNQPLYMEADKACPTVGFIDIQMTGTDLNLTDDSEAGVTLPFPVLFQGALYGDMTVGNNGGLQLGSTTANIGYGGNFNTMASGTMFPWGDDLDDETGNVYWETIGVAPNRILVIQWDNICNFSGSAGAPTVTFQVQIHESNNEIYYVYDDVVFGGSYAGDDYGANADIGLSGNNQDITISTNNSAYLTDNSCVHFYYTDCPNPTNLIVNYILSSEVSLSWTAGLYGETNWTVIYDTAGFDPTTGGTSISYTSTNAVIAGLNQNTTYDFYIYSDCQVGTLQSFGLLSSLTTLPFCSNPSSLSTSTAVDSVFTDWNWIADPSGLYPIQNFNVQYGTQGFNLGTGTLATSGPNFADTTVNPALLSGGVYDIYVQANCGLYSSAFIGPISFTMPLTNDSICDATLLNVDGSLYVFNNAGATVQANEASIAPPTTGPQQTDGWINSNLSKTTWFKFVAPPSGQVRISAVDKGFDGQIAVYSAISCSPINSLVLVAANDNEIDGSSLAPNFTICGLVSGVEYFLMHDSYTTATGEYSIRISEIDLIAGTTSAQIEVCEGDSVDLFTGIVNYNLTTGSWIDVDNTMHLNGSMFGSGGLISGLYNFDYELIDGCASDMS